MRCASRAGGRTREEAQVDPRFPCVHPLASYCIRITEALDRRPIRKHEMGAGDAQARQVSAFDSRSGGGA